jgi:hypothetical protein
MYANYNEYMAIISIIRVHSRNSRLNSDLISVALDGGDGLLESGGLDIAFFGGKK